MWLEAVPSLSQTKLLEAVSSYNIRLKRTGTYSPNSATTFKGKKKCPQRFTHTLYLYYPHGLHKKVRTAYFINRTFFLKENFPLARSNTIHYSYVGQCEAWFSRSTDHTRLPFSFSFFLATRSRVYTTSEIYFAK